MVAETRNHLVAAIQNCSSAHGSLKPVNIPYCTKDDVEVSCNHHIYLMYSTSEISINNADMLWTYCK